MGCGQAAENRTDREAVAPSTGWADRNSGRLSDVARTTSTSLLRYSPGFVLLLIVVADSVRYADPDLWWHIRFGQAVLSGHLMTRDPYSYSAAGHLWRDDEWLAEVLMAGVYNISGVLGLKIMKFALSAVTIVLMALAVSETGVVLTVQLVVMTVAAFALAPQMQYRPQLFTFALLAALMLILTRENRRRRAPVWLAVPILALWANFHGGFIIGIAALGTYTSIRIIEEWVSAEAFGRSKSLVLVTIGATLATLATPYGFNTWLAVGHILSNPVTRVVIADWRPLLPAVADAWRGSWSTSVFLFGFPTVMVAAFVLAVVISPYEPDRPLVAVAFLMAAAAFVSVRNMALFVIAAAAPLSLHAEARHAKAVLSRWRAPRTFASLRSAAHPLVPIVAASVLAAYTGLLSKRLPFAGACPSGAVDFMASHDLSGNVLCEFSWGGYLIWHAAPHSRVFMDSRYDLVYPAQVVGDYLKFYFDGPGGADVLVKYPHDFVLIPPTSGGYRVTSRSAAWKLIYEDPVAALFARANSPAARLPGVPIRGTPKPSVFP
jgi:hypothetical protein